MSLLKFALPVVPDEKVPLLPSKIGAWKVPHLLVKPGDAEKLDIFLLPMAESKLSKLPAAMEAAKKKAEERRAAQEAKRQASGKAKAKGKSKAKASKRGREQDTCEFDAEVVDDQGNTRAALFADDIFHSINYTLEGINEKIHKRPCIEFAMDMACLFCLHGDLEAAGGEKCTGWVKARKHIKAYLNRTHSLHARQSDPDVLPVPGPGESAGNEESETGGVKTEIMDDEEMDADLYQRVSAILRSSSLSHLSAFLDDNFNFSDASGLACSGLDIVHLLLHPRLLYVLRA